MSSGKTHRKTLCLEKPSDLGGKIIMSTPGVTFSDETLSSDRMVMVLFPARSGALIGFWLNQSLPQNIVVMFDHLCKNLLDVQDINPGFDIPIQYGGQEDCETVFLLFSANEVVEHIGAASGYGPAKFTHDKNIMQYFASHEPPQDMLPVLGYQIWDPKELFSLIQNGHFMVCDADRNLVFNVPTDQKWAKAVEKAAGRPLHTLAHKPVPQPPMMH